VGIPLRVGRADVQFARLGADVGIVNVGAEDDARPGVDFVIIVRQVDFKFENGVRVQSPPEENYTVEGSEGCERWEDVYSRGGVLFEVFVFDGDLVVSESLFSVRFGCDGCSP